MSFGDYAQSIIDIFTSASGSGGSLGCAAQQASCTGASFYPVAASFATQGMFVQADMIFYLLNSHLGYWAPLLYMVAAASGLIGVALGMPPKAYVWFLLGPGIYYWLIGSTVPMHGMEWRVANIPQNQAEVWKLSEVGLKNLGIVQREGIAIFSDKPPSEPVHVSWFFAFYDSLISELVQQITAWTGVYNFSDGAGGASSNIRPFGSSGGGSGGISIFGLINQVSGGRLSSFGPFFNAGNSGSSGRGTGSVTGSLGGANANGPGLSMLANLKWELLQDITTAKMQNANLKVAFADFFTNECGVELSRVVSSEALTASMQSGGQNLPASVFIGGNIGAPESDTYGLVATALSRRTVPITDDLRRFVLAPRNVAGKIDPTAFLNFFDADGARLDAGSPNSPPSSLSGKIAYQLRNSNEISCDKYFSLLVNGARWESGQVFNQLLSRAGKNVPLDGLIYVLTYGWDLRTCGNKPAGTNVACVNPDQPLNPIQTARFIQDTILLYMLKNELMFETSKLAEKRSYLTRTSSSQLTRDSAMKQIATTGQITKYGELYTWTQMVPYIQGILLYVLAMSYPFACVLIVVPGKHKILLQWMAFWAWVKLWDAGFAVVQVLERSVWAAMGNSSNSRNVMKHVLDLQQWAAVGRECVAAGTNGSCAVPRICEASEANTCVTQPASLLALLKIFDKAMLIQGSLDLDLANGFYIFVMAALYLAVPTITGQLVLGAKAGSAGLVNSMIGGVAGESGRNAGNAYSGEINQIARAKSAATAQSAYLRSMRNVKGGRDGTTSLAELAMKSGNTVAGLEMQSSALGTVNSANDYLQSGLGTMQTQQRNALGEVQGFMKYGKDLDKNRWGNEERIDKHGKNPVTTGSRTTGGTGGGRGSGNAPTGGFTASEQNHNEQFGPLAAVAAPIQKMYDAVGNTQGGRNAERVMQTALDAGEFVINRGQFAVDSAMNARNIEMNKNRADAAITGVDVSTAARGWNLAGSRLGAEAGFAAESGAWSIRNEYSAAMSPQLAAIGVSPGVMDPGGRPTSFEGAAMSGQLGEGIWNMAHYSDGPGSEFFNQQAAVMEDLQATYGRDEMNRWMHVTTPMEALSNVVTGPQGVSASSFWSGTKDLYLDTKMAGIDSSKVAQQIGGAAPISKIEQNASSNIRRFGNTDTEQK